MTQAGAVHVLIVAYGDPDHLRSCLTGLGAPPGVVTVIDNGLSDEARGLCRLLGATYVRPVRNLGFAGGVNAGLAAADLDGDVLLLNPDAVLGWAEVRRLQLLLHGLPSLAAVTPLLQRPTGEREPASWPIPSPLSTLFDAIGLSALSRGPRFLTGAVLLLRGQALREIGGFDERYFLYAEEADWQLRAQRAGWSVAIANEVVAVHLGGATSSSVSTRSEQFHRSARLFARKWYGKSGAAVMWTASLAAAFRRSLTGGPVGRADAVATLHIYLRRNL